MRMEEDPLVQVEVARGRSSTREAPQWETIALVRGRGVTEYESMRV